MRIPLASPLKTRTNDLAKDARVKNGTVEVKGEMSAVRNRPGATDIMVLDGSYYSDAIAQLLFEDADGNVLVMNGDTFTGYYYNRGDFISIYGPEYLNNTYSGGTTYEIGETVRYEGVEYVALQPDSASHTPGTSFAHWYADSGMPAITGTVSSVTAGTPSSYTDTNYYNSGLQHITTQITVTPKTIVTSHGTWVVNSINVDRSAGSTTPNWPSGTVPGFSNTFVNYIQSESWVSANSGTYGIGYSSGAGYYYMRGGNTYSAVGNGTIDWAFSGAGWSSNGYGVSSG